MEYRIEEEDGDAAWYKLIGDRNTPVKVVHSVAQRNVKREYDPCNIIISPILSPTLHPKKQWEAKLCMLNDIVLEHGQEWFIFAITKL